MHNASVRFSPRLSLLVLLSTTSLATLGCDEAKLNNAPAASPNCGAPILEYPCAPLPSGTTGCTGDLDSGPALDRAVTLDGSFPAKCTVIINDPVPDEQNQCSQLGTCTCNEADGGAFGGAGRP